MKHKKYSLTLLFTLIFSFVFANDTAIVLKLQTQITGQFVRFEVDNLGNIYALTKTNQLKKFNAAGDSVAVFNDVKNYGTLTNIDVSNPQKLVLFYKQFATAVILDRFLNFQNKINFRNQNLQLLNTVALAFDNQYWLFDEQKFTLKKVNGNGTLLTESNDTRQALGTVLQVAKIIDREGLVYLYDTKKGIYVFDYYNNFKTKYNLTNIETFDVEEGFIYTIKKQKNTEGFIVERLNTATLQLVTSPISLSGKKLKSIKLLKNIFYLQTTNGIEVHTY
jgi:hypothetical protein